MIAKKTRVFLVDDHEIVRQALSMWVERSDDLEIVGEASNVVDALRGISTTSPDIAVIDLQLGGDSGITVCEQIRIDHPQVKSLILTGMQDRRHLMEVIAAGASGYVQKAAPMPEIVDAIRAVAAGKTMLAAAAAGVSAPPSSNKDGPMLSDQEERVLELVAAGLTNQQTAHRLNIANQTVKNHVSNVLRKLGVASRTQAAVYAAQRRSDDS